jgi:hypothetical protein
MRAVLWPVSRSLPSHPSSPMGPLTALALLLLAGLLTAPPDGVAGYHALTVTYGRRGKAAQPFATGVLR